MERLGDWLAENVAVPLLVSSVLALGVALFGTGYLLGSLDADRAEHESRVLIPPQDLPVSE